MVGGTSCVWLYQKNAKGLGSLVGWRGGGGLGLVRGGVGERRQKPGDGGWENMGVRSGAKKPQKGEEVFEVGSGGRRKCWRRGGGGQGAWGGECIGGRRVLVRG